MMRINHVKIFEDFNKNDSYENFKESINDSMSECGNFMEKLEDNSDNSEVISACIDVINISSLMKELINNNSKLLKAQCKIYELSLNICIKKCADIEDNISCIEACKRSIIDCSSI